jgi:hypothetical protein
MALRTLLHVRAEVDRGQRQVSQSREDRLRTRSQTLASWVSAAVGIFGAVGLASYALSGGPPRKADIAGLLVIAVLLAGVGVVSWRGAVASVRPGPRELVIVNPLRSVRLSWSDIDHFDIGRAGYWPRVGRAHLTDGRVIHMWAIQGADPSIRKDPDRRAGAQVDLLNARLQAAKVG